MAASVHRLQLVHSATSMIMFHFFMALLVVCWHRVRLLLHLAPRAGRGGLASGALAKRSKSGEHLCWKSSMFGAVGLPHSAFADEDVGEHDELSGDGNDGELGGFSSGDEATEEGFHIGVKAGGGDGGEIEDAPYVGLAAPDDADALALAGLISDGGEAGQHADLL